MFNCGLTDLRLVKPRDGWPNAKAAGGGERRRHRAGQGAALRHGRGRDRRSASRLCHDGARPLHGEAHPDAARRPPPRCATSIGCGRSHAASCSGRSAPGSSTSISRSADTVLSVPLNPAFSSLNLAQAVLLIGYEWFQPATRRRPAQLVTGHSKPADKERSASASSSISRRSSTAAASCATADKRPSMVRNLRNLFQRADCTEQELRTLHGVVTAFVGRAPAKRPRGRVDIGALAAIVAAHSRESGQKCPVPLTGVNYRDNNNAIRQRIRMSKREESKYKINRRLGVNLWGRGKSPLNQARLRSRPAWPAAQEAVRLRHAAHGEAEAQGLLRQYRRAPVPPLLRGGDAAPRRHRRESDRAAGAPARRRGLSHEIRADACSPRASSSITAISGQRQARQHRAPILVKDGDAIEVRTKIASRWPCPRSVEIDRARRARLSRGRSRPDEGQVRARARSWRTCPIRCRWSRTWSSSSTRADAGCTD